MADSAPEDAAVLALSNALGDTKYHPGAPSAKGGGRKFTSYEDIIEAGTKAVIGMKKQIEGLENKLAQRTMGAGG